MKKSNNNRIINVDIFVTTVVGIITTAGSAIAIVAPPTAIVQPAFAQEIAIADFLSRQDFGEEITITIEGNDIPITGSFSDLDDSAISFNPINEDDGGELSVNSIFESATPGDYIFEDDVFKKLGEDNAEDVLLGTREIIVFTLKGMDIPF